MIAILAGAWDVVGTRFQRIFQRRGWVLIRVQDICGTVAAMRPDVDVVLCNVELPDGSWRQILDFAKFQPNPPQVIVFSQLKDDELRAEVLQRGAYCMSPVSLREQQVVSTLRLAAGSPEPVPAPRPPGTAASVTRTTAVAVGRP